MGQGMPRIDAIRQTAKKQNYPQTKSLSWINACKTGQPNLFQHKNTGTLQVHTRMVSKVISS